MNKKILSALLMLLFSVPMITYSVSAKTDIPEEITSDTIWTKSSSPYEIEKNVYVRKGATLTIESGVKIIFKAHRKAHPTDADQRIRLTVQGKLIANGTSAEPVVFTSNEEIIGLWGGILFDHTEDNKSFLEYCQIERASSGIACFKSSPVINNCYFTKNELAIDCEDWSSPVIMNNTFTDNGFSVNTIGVINCVRYSSPKIKNNLIEKNIGPSIHVGIFSSPEISHNTIAYNTSHGISIYSFSEPVVLNNEISYNGCFGQQGIVVHQASPTIIGNSIHNNCKIGISVSGDASPLISGNNITNNDEGIICVSSSPVIIFNVLKNYQHGIVISGNSLPTINYNNFNSDRSYANVLLENCTQQINAQNNWWNTDKQASVAKGIIGKETNSLLGAVATKPFLMSEVNLSDYLNINLEYQRKMRAKTKYVQLKNDSLLFMSFRDGNWEIYSADARAKEINNLTNNPSVDIAPCWSPDGKEIAFSSNRSGNLEIHIMKNDGNNVEQLTDNIFNDSVPIWSFDGKRIAYWSELRQIFVIERDGSNKKSIDPNSYAESLPGFLLTSCLWVQDN